MSRVVSGLVKLSILGLLSGSVVGLSGCAAITTEIQHGSLQTNTKMSNTIFLPPEATENKVVYLKVRNTSDQNISIESQLEANLKAEGYSITDNPEQASQMVQVNILQAGKSDMTDINAILADGFGSALAGTAVGIGTSSNVMVGGAVGGLIAGAATTIVDSMVTDVTYSVTTDVQISVRVPKGTQVSQTTQSNLQQGTATKVSSTYSTQTNWQQYQTRIISYADKVNLKFEEAAPLLEKSLAHEIANIL